MLHTQRARRGPLLETPRTHRPLKWGPFSALIRSLLRPSATLDRPLPCMLLGTQCTHCWLPCECRDRYERRCAEARAKGVGLPKMPPKLVAAQQEERSKREAEKVAAREELLSQRSNASARGGQRSSRGKKGGKKAVEKIATTTVSFEYTLHEFHPPPAATLHLRRISVLSGLEFNQPATAVASAPSSPPKAPGAKAGAPPKSERFNTAGRGKSLSSSSSKATSPKSGSSSSPTPAVAKGELGKPYLRFVLLEVGAHRLHRYASHSAPRSAPRSALPLP